MPELRLNLRIRPHPVSHCIPLDLLSAGEEGRVSDVEGDRATVTRLAEMGLREGIIVRMVKPGRPCIIAVGNHRLSFRCEDMATVLVEITRKR
jgi:Fe2+ transport system protein FeoA